MNQLNFSIEPVEGTYDLDYFRLKKKNQNSTKDLGLPELPIYSTFYMVDPNKNYDFNIIVNDSYTISDIEIYPYQGLDEPSKKADLKVDNSFYNSNSIYPEKNITESELIPISVIPYSYNLETKELEVFTNIEITINESESLENRQPMNMKRSHLFEQIYGDIPMWLCLSKCSVPLPDFHGVVSVERTRNGF